MNSQRTTLVATAIVIGTGSFWGFYWLPVRQLTQSGLPGAWGTLAITTSAALLLLPFAIVRRAQFRAADRIAVASLALGGTAFALYSTGFVYGRVAIIILLFFLTPVWSTLIGRYVFGWHTSRMRRLAIAVGLIGLGIMLSADGTLPIPRSIGEWMALASGILWSIATTGIKTKSNINPISAAFIFACGAVIASLILAPLLEPVPNLTNLGLTLSIALGAGGLWWGLSMVGLMWATVRLEPARVGILLMAEVLIGAVTAAHWAGEHLSPLELIGGIFVLCAGILEVWPTKTLKQNM